MGQMRGFPLVGGFLRAPAASRWSGGPRPLGGGQRFSGHLMISDETGRFLMRSSSSSHPQARPASRAKRGMCIPGLMARRAGVPRW